ncbi:MAG: ATP-binding cassette domain-containing protein [Desulfomicrobium escambiense]|nr:ATP-binding cassette domain-containing protein [Desulfomicrobium escambiense]
MSIIQLSEVRKTYPLGKTEVQAVRGVSLEIQKGDFVSIAGPSGSGKSTILNLIECIDVPSAGTVRVGGMDTGGLSDRELTRLRHKVLGFIFQSFNLIPVLDVYENVEFPSSWAGTAQERGAERVGRPPDPGGGPGEVGAPQGQRALRWPAPEGRHSPRPGHQARGGPGGRAHGQPGLRHGGIDPGPDAEDEPGVRHHLRFQHPRPQDRGPRGSCHPPSGRPDRRGIPAGRGGGSF